MTAISQACYLEDVMIGAQDSTMRDEISMYVEMAGRLSASELTDWLNNHMKMRMFVVGNSITVADITIFSAVVKFWRNMESEDKFAKPNTFRWVDHI